MLLGGSLVALYGWRPFFIALGWCACVAGPMGPVDAHHGIWPAPGIRGKVPGQERSCASGRLGTCICLFCVNYYLYFMVTWLPFYLVRERH